MELSLDTPLASLDFLDAKTRKALAAGDFVSVGDALTHYPFRYEDRRAFDGWPSGGGEAAVCLRGVVLDAKLKRIGYRRAFVEVTLSKPETEGLEGFAEPVILRWFNMPFIHKQFAADQELVAYGKVKEAKGRKLVMDHPDYEILDDSPEEAATHLERIVPVYGAREGVPQKTLRRTVFLLLEHLRDDAVTDLLPEPSAEGGFAGLTRAAALRGIHFPESQEAMERSRRYLALEEFFVLQLNVLRRRARWDTLTGAGHCGPGELLDRWLATLPFSLTEAQTRSIAEIRADLASARPMNRMLQGDVGSGKTFVAMAAMLLAVESGCAAALMAPTQILAEQHYLHFRRWLEPLGLRIGLRTASRKENGFMPLFSGAEDRPQMLIGTHALLHGKEEIPDLGLAVIDEQHKFGVEQRAKLVKRGIAPDVLVMTATPIPRTLTMTVYGDLDVSIIDELPAGRRPIVTAVRQEPDPAGVAAFLREKFEEGRQAYLVFPLVDESEALGLKAAVKEHAAWVERLAPRAVGLLHGRMPPAEKEAVMRRFREGGYHALVSTSVIEVGVDVPNATVMIVFEAERFGLAQLHQLRGRVGRGEHKSWCILISSGKDPEAVDRLKTLETTTDGFAVAETDLRLRGPGDILGTAQSGLPGLKLGDLIRDAGLVKTARRLAAEIIATDPDLTLPRHTELRPHMLEKAGPVHG